MLRTSKAHRVPTCAVLALMIASPLGNAADQSIVIATTPETSAFARYVKALHEPDPFAVRDMFGFSVSATLAELYKTAKLIAVPKTGEADGDYITAYAAGDGTVLAEVIPRCLNFKAELYKMPVNSTAIAPENYKFRFAGEVNMGAGHAFRYKIVPRKSDGVSITGYLWLDSRTGREVMLVGRLKKAPSIDGPVSIVRETKLGDDGVPIARITHLSFSVAALGRAEVEVAEYLAPSAGEALPLPAQRRLLPEQSN